MVPKQNYFIKADITDEKQLANIKKKIKKRFGLLDGMVNLIANDPKVENCVCYPVQSINIY